MTSGQWYTCIFTDNEGIRDTSQDIGHFLDPFEMRIQGNTEGMMQLFSSALKSYILTDKLQHLLNLDLILSDGL